jgi:hypothetical protein
MKKAKPKTKESDSETPEYHAESKQTWIQEIEVKGENLVAKIKELAAESHVKRVRIIEPDGDIALDIPLTYGAIAGGVFVIAAPVLAVIGALAAFVTKVKIEVVRDDTKK